MKNDVKENSIDESEIQQLTDDALKTASGGVNDNDLTRVCPKCGFVYFGGGNQYEREYYKNLHRQMNCDEAI